MRALIQRVKWASVEVVTDCGMQVVGRIDRGVLVYVGVAVGDEASHVRRLAEKVANLRVFPDAEGKLNLSVRDTRGGVLAVSNFTLLADACKGRRPTFVAAAPAEQAEVLHDTFIRELRSQGLRVEAGAFGMDMTVGSAADGPVNIIVDVPGTNLSGTENGRTGAIHKQ